MTDLTNYLMPPVSQEPNMLAYDDTQGMTRQRPADPLRWLADYVGQNKDLPAPQFFMDPRSLSARNMLHSALNTSANWLDGTKDPSLIGVQEMVSPTGLAGMAGVASRAAGTGGKLASAMADNPSPTSVRGVHYTTADFDKFDPKQFGGTGDAFGIGVYSTPMEWAHAQRAQSASNAYSYGNRFEEGARSIPTEHTLSAPFRIDMPDNVGVTSKADWGALRQNWFGPKWKHNMAPYEAAEAGRFASREDAAQAFNAALKAHGKDGVTVFDDGVMQEVMSMSPGTVKSPLTGATLFADNARSSAPGTVVNSLDMSEAARMARAKEMGFDTDRVLYHGSQSKFSEFDPSLGHEYGIFLSPNKGYAQPYAGLSDRGARNQPGAYFVRAEKVARPHSTEDMAQSANKHLTKADADRLRAQGIDAIEPKEVPEFVLFDPAKIRSVDAAFDPAKRDSTDLLASSPSASTPGLAANSTQQPERPVRQDDQGVMSILRRYGLAD